MILSAAACDPHVTPQASPLPAAGKKGSNPPQAPGTRGHSSPETVLPSQTSDTMRKEQKKPHNNPQSGESRGWWEQPPFSLFTPHKCLLHGAVWSHSCTPHSHIHRDCGHISQPTLSSPPLGLIRRRQQECCFPVYLPALFPVGVWSV